MKRRNRPNVNHTVSAAAILVASAALFIAACDTASELDSATEIVPETVIEIVVDDGAVLAEPNAESDEVPAESDTVLAQAGEPTSQPTADDTDDTDDTEAASTGHFGAAFASDAAPISLATAIETCVGTGAICKVEGTIGSVCQARGCWFTLASDEVTSTVRIRMQDYGFFVPRDAVGAHVVFEGTLTDELVPQDTVQHYADDEAAVDGVEAREVTGPERSYEFMITGAEISQQ